MSRVQLCKAPQHGQPAAPTAQPRKRDYTDADETMRNFGIYTARTNKQNPKTPGIEINHIHLMTAKSWKNNKETRICIMKTLCKHEVDETGKITRWIDVRHSFVAPGTGDYRLTCVNTRNMLEEQQQKYGRDNVRVIRGYKIFEGRCGGHVLERCWKAITHMVLEVPSSRTADGKLYICATANGPDIDPDQPFLFIRSSRVHRDLTDEQLMNGAWFLGQVFGGHQQFVTQAVEVHRTGGRGGQSVGRSPEECKAVRNISAALPLVFCIWARKFFPEEDPSALAELMGFPIRDREDSDVTDKRGNCVPPETTNKTLEWDGKRMISCEQLSNEELKARSYHTSTQSLGMHTWEELRDRINACHQRVEEKQITRAEGYSQIFDILNAQKECVDNGRAKRLSLALGRLGLATRDF